MKYGFTNKFTTGHFNLRDSFDIPDGTAVEYGIRDCNGIPYLEWVLPANIAAQLSGNEHDSRYRFVVIHPDNVKESRA